MQLVAGFVGDEIQAGELFQLMLESQPWLEAREKSRGSRPNKSDIHELCDSACDTPDAVCSAPTPFGQGLERGRRARVA